MALDAATESVDIGGSWVDGEQRTLELEISKDRPVTEQASSVTVVDLRATALPDGRWSMEWANQETAISDLGLPDAVLGEAEEALARVPKVEIDYTLSARGFIESIDNTAEIRAAMTETLNLLAELQPGDAALLELTELYTQLPDEQIQVLFTEDVQLFHAFDGISLAVDNPLSGADLLPNSLGGAPFPAITTLAIDELAGDDGCVRVSIRTIPDPDRFAEIVAQTVADVFGEDTVDGDSDPYDGMSVENLIVATVDGRTGRVLRVDATQSIDLLGDSRTDRKTVSDITGDCCS